MATIKSYTSLEQSKKLAEILPLESADMYYDYDVQKHEYYPMIMDEQFDDMCVPCWSLSALLDVLSSSTLDSSNDHYYRLHCMEQFTGWHENPIDTCYEMIVGLHGLKML